MHRRNSMTELAVYDFTDLSLRNQESAAMTQVTKPQVISRGLNAGTYQAFPDICRRRNGELVTVFYAGYTHVSLPNGDYPKGGRICLIRSTDEGKTWNAPEIAYDGPDDDRDPHIAELPDGSLVISYFSLRKDSNSGPGYRGLGVSLIRSTDGGKKWGEPQTIAAVGWYCSAPVRVLPDKTLVLGVYWYDQGKEWGGVVRSTDGGKTWGEPIPVGKGQNLPLDAETDIIVRKDGTLYAALRSSKVNMHYATSTDGGKTWSTATDIGFKGHAPHLYRLRSGEVLLAHRVPHTAVHISRDDCRTWTGPFEIDIVGGAYPSCVELSDGTVLVVYYEEGAGSAIRSRRFTVLPEGIHLL